MTLTHLSIINYRNIEEATLDLSPKINCFVGRNGAGKTNVLDAVYFLSFCHSSATAQDSLVIRHDRDFLVLEGTYADAPGPSVGVAADAVASAEPTGFTVYCGMKRGQKKHFKRDKKEYRRLSEHIGLVPIVLVSPQDTLLIEGGSEERRRLMDQVIAQQDRRYIESLNRYNKALQQRNTLLRQADEQAPDPEVLGLFEEQMAAEGEYIYRCRSRFAEQIVPLFQQFYAAISGGREQVSLAYRSHCQRGPLLDLLRLDRGRDLAVGYSLHGVHRDDLDILLDGHPMRREGSQGQQKTFVIALKLAQFELLRQGAGRPMPLLLLDDIFDKLDAVRVEQIVRLVAGEQFGQIFITDTNRDHLDQILLASSHDYKIFYVDDGVITAR